MDERLTDVEKRVAAIEADFAEVKIDVHKIKNEQQKSVAEMTTLKDTVAAVEKNTSDILVFVSGANNVFGFAKKHWKTGMTFGAGIMTAAGIGNPDIWKYVANFFGGNS